ncbi:antirestriction protein ArdR [Pseudomonas aeruginosa]|uniref:antirestriction protein ArdR n=1 Tax=Pseudomonas aeruginosa TaxID=287 RepID=UPI003CC63115
MKSAINEIRAVARTYRNANPDYPGGVVLVWQGDAYGWKDKLRDAGHEQPGAYAVDESGHVFVAEGGDSYNGAKEWVAVAE